jgi:hypothetical protein
MGTAKAASLHLLKPNYANRTIPDLHRVAVGEHPCRLCCLIIVRARQGVLIENVPFGREDKHLVLFRGYIIRSAAKPPNQAMKLATASDTNARSMPPMPSHGPPRVAKHCGNRKRWRQ